eukprot:m.129936 g.129936  ORF g.129936 m.129936 type:complete len:50 (-) comp13895_c0_seq15:855-1004(-)
MSPSLLRYALYQYSSDQIHKRNKHDSEGRSSTCVLPCPLLHQLLDNTHE